MHPSCHIQESGKRDLWPAGPLGTIHGKGEVAFAGAYVVGAARVVPSAPRVPNLWIRCVVIRRWYRGLPYTVFDSTLVLCGHASGRLATIGR